MSDGITIRQLFEKAVQLTEESKLGNDPDDQPYLTLYAARKILTELKSRIENLENEKISRSESQVNLGLASLVVRYMLGVNHVDTDEKSAGEELLNMVADQLDDDSFKTSTCGLKLNTLNQLGILWSQRQDYQKAKEYLTKAATFYFEYKRNVERPPWLLKDIFEPDNQVEDRDEIMFSDRKREFESLFTHTLYYLAQVCAKLDDKTLAAQYCHITLKRQLESEKYDPVDWSLNAATLSQYYIGKSNFRLAKHCLCSAHKIYDKMISEKYAHKNLPEEVANRKADILRCWIKYAIALLTESKSQITSDLTIDENLDLDLSENNRHIIDALNEIGGTLLFDLELDAYDELITDNLASTYADAKPVFQAALVWVSEAKRCFTLDDHCSDYVEIVQDHSSLFKALSFFETDLSAQCRMHKRRIDMLTAVVDELNPQFYLLVCRQLLFEIAEIHSEMVDLKYMIAQEGDANPTSLRKINQLALAGISFYNRFLESYRKNNGEQPEKYSDDDVRPVLLAHFVMARLYNKLIDSDTKSRLDHILKSKENYAFIVDYCAKHSDASQLVAEELKLSKELVELLPKKMNQILSQSN